ncbi:L-ectoine synthase [Longimycelium tulufanense]|uniref:L-ectoine synthase n=1 Tax=Longimycelium tulufanense TaxID=907463 RepID=A0A8J3FXK5_9PSEU|nr:ectoine synthase [Longimycelium tulufanense]GGM63503.1 L-ectoine synthase [Longimycelium tulufanense]
MFVRSLDEVKGTDRDVDWGNGRSYRLLVESDNMGYTICHTVVRAGTTSLLRYQNHLESCYCIAGEGEIEDMAGKVYPIRTGDLYALDQHDQHYLRAGAGDLILISVFNPPLKGHERHHLGRSHPSGY